MHKIATRISLSILFLSSMICSALDHSKFVKNPKVVFFDVHNTLIDVQNLKSVEHFGFWDSARALFQGNLNNQFNDLISQIPAPFSNSQEKISKEKEMSDLQKCYLLGKLSSEECIKLADTWIEGNKNKFESDYQRNLFKNMIHFYFESKTFLKYQKHTSSMDLMKNLFDVKTKDGKRKNVVVVLANQSKEQVAALKEVFPDIFKFSDIQLFSCNEGLLTSNNSLIDKALSMCPAKSYYVSFVVNNTDSAKEEPTIVNGNVVPTIIKGHRIERVKSDEAENRLVSYGAMSTEAGI